MRHRDDDGSWTSVPGYRAPLEPREEHRARWSRWWLLLLLLFIPVAVAWCPGRAVADDQGQQSVTPETVVGKGLLGTGGGGSGTVTSITVALTSIPWLQLANPNITTSGTITFSPASAQPAGRVVGTCGASTSVALCAMTGVEVPLATTSAQGAVVLATPSSDTTAGHAVQANDTRLSNPRAPTAHAASHQNGGGDEVATATPAADAIPKAGAGSTLAAAWLPVLGLANGATGLTSAPNSDVMVGSGSAWVATAIPGCLDTGGNHLNFNASANAFSCGSSSSGGGGGVTGPVSSTDRAIATWSGTAGAALRDNSTATISATGVVTFHAVSSDNILGGLRIFQQESDLGGPFDSFFFSPTNGGPAIFSGWRLHACSTTASNAENGIDTCLSRGAAGQWSFDDGTTTDGAGSALMTSITLKPLASAPFTCAGGTEGAEYHNSVSHQRCVCNGTSWVMSPGGSPGISTGC
jgi:hypothetical protein